MQRGTCVCTYTLQSIVVCGFYTVLKTSHQLIMVSVSLSLRRGFSLFFLFPRLNASGGQQPQKWFICGVFHQPVVVPLFIHTSCFYRTVTFKATVLKPPPKKKLFCISKGWIRDAASSVCFLVELVMFAVLHVLLRSDLRSVEIQQLLAVNTGSLEVHLQGNSWTDCR